MDGDPVTGEPSQPAVTKSLAEMLMDICPSYMALGMTYDEFWHCNTKVHKAYREAWTIRRKNEEWARWRQGAYNFAALMCAAPVIRASFGKGKAEPGEYPGEPWPITRKEAEERQQKKARDRYLRMREKLFAEARIDQQRQAQEEEQKEAVEDGRRSED